MSLEAFLDSNSQLAIPLMNGAGGLLEALSSHNSLKNEENLNSILNMAQLNSNLASDVMNAAIQGPSSTSRTAVGAYLQSLGKINMEPYTSLPSSPMSFSGKNPLNVFSNDDTLSHLHQGMQKERKKQQKENTDLYKSKLQNRQDSLPVRIKQEPATLTSILKKPRHDVKQDNIQQQEIIQELLLKEIHDRNPQLTAMIKQYRQQNQLHHQPILHASPQPRMRSALQEQGNQQVTFAPLLDGAICSRRLKQYLYHLRNNIHDNSIAYWKKFVSEYYAPGSKKRWCFSKYENIELHTTGVFCPISVEKWCCDICGSRSGNGLEATSDIFPRLFKIKFESGMLDEILFLDSPRACKISSGLVLEYGKATQESVYENFRVVHEGKLRILFRHDLKILSWEFCAQNHEEFLLSRLITPQVNRIVQAAEQYQSDIHNGASFRVSSEDLQPISNMFVSAANQLARNMELPLVNDLGYPKRFIRCLQIAEVVNSMKDLMTFSKDTKMGPIECLNKYNQGGQTENGATSGNSHQAFLNLNRQFLGQNSYLHNESPHYSLRASTHAINPYQASVDRLLDEMVAATSRGKTLQNAYKKLNNEAVSVNLSNRKCVTSNELMHCGESSNFAASGKAISANAPRSGNLSSAIGRNITVKAEPYSPEQLPEAFQSSAGGLSKIDDWGW